MMELVKPYDPVLSNRVQPIRQWTDGAGILQWSCDHLYEIGQTMLQFIAQHGEMVCLAANQVGMSLRMFMMPPGIQSSPDVRRFFINPTITTLGLGASEHWEWETCPNFPDMQVRILRLWVIKVRAFDINGKEFVRRLEGTAARAAIQAIELLNGTTIIDHSCLPKHTPRGITIHCDCGRRHYYNDGKLT